MGAAKGLADDASSEQQASRPQIGDQVARFEFQDTWFLPRSLDDFNAKTFPTPRRAFVLVFTNTTCPLVQRYWPRLKELEAKYREQGVQFVAVNVGGGGLIRFITAGPNNAEAREKMESTSDTKSHLQPQRMRDWRVR